MTPFPISKSVKENCSEHDRWNIAFHFGMLPRMLLLDSSSWKTTHRFLLNRIGFIEDSISPQAYIALCEILGMPSYPDVWTSDLAVYQYMIGWFDKAIASDDALRPWYELGTQLSDARRAACRQPHDPKHFDRFVECVLTIPAHFATRHGLLHPLRALTQERRDKRLILGELCRCTLRSRSLPARSGTTAC